MMARSGRCAQKKTGATTPAFVLITFWDEGLGFPAGCEKDAGVVNAVADMMRVRVLCLGRVECKDVCERRVVSAGWRCPPIRIDG